MKHFILILTIIIVLILMPNSEAMAIGKDGKLSQCLNESNCVLAEWKISGDISNAFKEITHIASNLARVKIIKTSENYWHGVVRSLIFRFPDDLEVLRLPKENKIQVRSSSRIGISDMGINRNRIQCIYEEFKRRESL